MTMHSGTKLFGSADYENHAWTISTTGLFRLLRIDAHEVAMVDTALNVVATMHNASTSRFQSPIILRDAQDTVFATVAGDGAGGIHAVAPAGTPILFAGRGPSGALDVLLTDTGCQYPLVVLFALCVGLESGLLTHGSTHEQAS